MSAGRWQLPSPAASSAPGYWSKRESALEQGWLLADLQQRFGHSLGGVGAPVRSHCELGFTSLGFGRAAATQCATTSAQRRDLGTDGDEVFVASGSFQSATVPADGTRQAAQLYAAWRQASPQIRQRILEQLQLFLKAQGSGEVQPTDASIQHVLRDLEMIAVLARRDYQRLKGATAELQHCNVWIKRRANRCVTSSIAP
jgi:hypothetical protein